MAKAKKVFLGVGHGGSDPGAVGYLKEADVNLQMALACRDYLTANGVSVKMSRTRDENDSLNEEITECNKYDPDLAMDIHNNAGRGDGFEVYYYSGGGISKTLAKNVEAEIKKIGQNSRGCKVRKNPNGTDYYGFIRLTKAPAVIVEGVFVDNKTDAKIADTAAEQKAFGYAYARGILKTLGVKDNGLNGGQTPAKTPASTSGAGSFKVKVSISNLYIRKGPGTSYGNKGFIPPGVYTIVKKDGRWGKLKSGAGWICLDYAKKI